MTHPQQPYNQPQQYPHGQPQPGYGYPQQPGPYGHGPAPYQPPPPPKKGMGAGAIVAIVLGSVFGGLILLVILGAALSDSSTSTKKPVTSEAAEKAPVKKDDAQADAKPATKPKTEPAAEPAEPAPVQLTVTKTTFRPSILHDGGDYTSVQVTIANNSDEQIDINPLYFAITDTTGLKHNHELGEDENQMDMMDLAPGEKATGVITGKGKFTPKYVTYTDGLFGEGVRGNVS
ncbi:DUF4352 domain-containing protein [Streptomyces sp. NPDC054847]|jgi:hypothetical protein